MGIDTNVYGVWGVRIEGYDTEFSEAYDQVYDTCPLTIISDGMNGEYVILGNQLFDSGNIRWGMEDGDECKQIEINNFSEMEQKYKEEFCKWFPKFKHYMDQPFRLIMFTHYH